MKNKKIREIRGENMYQVLSLVSVVSLLGEYFLIHLSNSNIMDVFAKFNSDILDINFKVEAIGWSYHFSLGNN
jgi:hypothetical protein